MITQSALEKAGVPEKASGYVDAGLGVALSMGGGLAAASIKVAAIRAADPLAKGLSGVSVALRADAGARALVNEEFKAFGGKATTDLAKAKMTDEGAKVTTTFLGRMKTACSWDLVKSRQCRWSTTR